MTNEEIRQVVHETLLETGTVTRSDIKAVVREAVHETLTTLGVDVGNPLTMQQDMHFVRQLRESSERIRNRSVVVVVGVLVTAALAALWVGFKSSLG